MIGKLTRTLAHVRQPTGRHFTPFTTFDDSSRRGRWSANDGKTVVNDYQNVQAISTPEKP